MTFLFEQLPGPDRIGQRLEWDTKLGDRHDLHLFASAGDPSNEQELTSLNSELVWDLFQANATRWKPALRFDASVGLNGRASAVGMDWINGISFNGGKSARAMVLTAVQIGENRKDGVFLQSRFRLNRRLAGGQDIGVELYDITAPPKRSGLLTMRITAQVLTCPSRWRTDGTFIPAY